MRTFFKQFHYGSKGFTLIELLVVVAILGVLAAVAVPNVGKFIGKGKSEALETELHDIQTATMAMLADSSTGVLDSIYAATKNMGTIHSTENTTGDLTLSDYLTGLNGTEVQSTASYAFDTDGTVTQSTP